MYVYVIAFKSSEAHRNADALSRLPLPDKPEEVPIPAELILLVERLLDAPVKAHKIRKWTRKDFQLSQVVQFILYGWPDMVDPQLKQYWSRRLELSVEDGCILWGSRVTIPPPGQRRMLAELHEGHPRMARIKGLARIHMWWPGMEQEIEMTVCNCHECQKN